MIRFEFLIVLIGIALFSTVSCRNVGISRISLVSSNDQTPDILGFQIVMKANYKESDKSPAYQQGESLSENNFRPSNFTSHPNVRIVGGNKAKAHSRPYQVALFIDADSDDNKLCGGSIISASLILTAGHCLYHRSTAIVIAGAHDLSKAESEQQRKNVDKKSFKVHEHYDPNTDYNDIGLIKLPSALNLNAFVATIALYKGSDNLVGQTIRVSGWGNADNGEPSPVLLYVDDPIITNSDCSLAWGQQMIDSQLCTSTVGGKAGKAGSCEGDSGSPLTISFNGALQQVGVVSYGTQDCAHGLPLVDVNTRVSSYSSWIKESNCDWK